MLAIMRQIDRERHTIHFVNFHPGQETEEVKEVVTGEMYSLKSSGLFRIIRLLKASDLVYCRNYVCAFFALFIRGITKGRFRIHSDLRGVVPEEVLRYKKPPLNIIYAFLMRFVEKIVLKRSNTVSCVSNPFREYLLQKGGSSEKITVVPNGVDTSLFSFDENQRIKIRRELGIEDHLVYLFSGSPSKWLRLEEMLGLYKKIHAAQKKAWLLILTGAKARFEASCQKEGVVDYSVYHLKAGEVPAYLMAGDYAFLLRSDDIVTYVSSPIKFAEYLAAGNRVVITPKIGDSSEFVEKHNAGVLADPLNFDDVASKVTKPVSLDEKKRISQLAATSFNKEEIYSSLFNSLGL